MSGSSNVVLQSEVFKALGHPVRLVMVHALRGGEKCVCDLQPLVGTSLPTISRHLAILKNAGVIASEKRGQKIFYRLELTCLNSVFDCMDASCCSSSDSATCCCG